MQVGIRIRSKVSLCMSEREVLVRKGPWNQTGILTGSPEKPGKARQQCREEPQEGAHNTQDSFTSFPPAREVRSGVKVRKGSYVPGSGSSF